MKEEWRWIPEYEGRYEVSNLGRVRSYARYRKPRLLKPYHDPRGYVQMVFTVDRKPRTHWLHRLVAAAFITNPENKPSVNHINGNKADNSAANLEWATYSENTTHGYRTGLLKPPMIRGERGYHKLTEKDVLAIRAEYVPRKVSHPKLAAKYGVDRRTIEAVLLRRTWTHI